VSTTCIKGLVLTMDEKGTVLPRGLVVFDGVDGVITAVDKEENLGKHKCDVLEGGENHVVMPGLINTHTHTPMIVFQGLFSGLTGFNWLKRVWFLEGLLKPSDIYLSAKMAMVLMLENGITTFSDHYFYEEEVVKAVEEVGMRAVLAKSIVEYSEHAPKHSVKDSVDFALKYANAAGGRVSTMIGIHSLYSCSIETVREAVEASLSTNIKIHMHFSESLHEVEHVKEKYGTTPAELAEKVGLMEARPLLAHATYLTDRDLEILGRYKPGVAYSPFTIMSWGQGVARVHELLEKGVHVSLATDGPLTSGDLCLFKEMKFTIAVQSSVYRYPGRIAPRNVLEMATRIAALNLGLENKVGSLEPGKRADILVLKPRLSRSIGLHEDPYHTVVYNLGCESVSMVYVNGKKLVDRGNVVGISVERLYKRVLDIRERIMNEAGSGMEGFSRH